MMTAWTRLGLIVAVTVAIGWGASPSIEANGIYVEARSADVNAGSCFINSEVQLVGNLAVFGWVIEHGQVNGVRLDGLKMAAAVKARSTLGDLTGEPYPVYSVLIYDERATPEQRLALRRFAQRMTGDLLERVVRESSMPIEFRVDGESIHDKRVSFTAGTLAAIRTRAIEAGDKVCGHEETLYPPLAKTDHAMAAFTLENRFNGDSRQDLGVRWSLPYKRNAFVATFHVSE
ncbi:MAG: DUF1326 domain-containing protein [Bryobacteraceae bacterium]